MDGNYEKVYVKVHAVFDADGQMLPRSFIWTDGEKHVIERVIDCKPAVAMRAGGQGDRFTIVVNGCESYLFFERNPKPKGQMQGKWFIEHAVR